MQYFISRTSLTSQFVKFRLIFTCEKHELLKLQLAAWRPGRYELANYAQKIRGFNVKFNDNEITHSKSSKDRWEFLAPETGTYEVRYEFYANQMDAGGSWSDDTQLYLNFTNCVFELIGREEEDIIIQIALPLHYKTATSLQKRTSNTWYASHYQELVDSPILASENLSHYSYQIESTQFHLWFNGGIHFDVDLLIKTFKAFTQRQIEDFKNFPVDDYHFIFQLLPYRHYHGVEHQGSTLITIGPDHALADHDLMKELIGVSSHELYHFWNVCRIRPKGIIPYDLSKEVYLDSGLVLEGVTTYMGDIYLLKSGFFNLESYCREILDKLIQKEQDSFGWKNQSIVESSLDLWLDGYQAGIPEKKVSIYNRGALIALCLDLILVYASSSLQKVMKIMWDRFGKTSQGYTLEIFKEIIEKETPNNSDIKIIFEEYVYGKMDILPLLKKLLEGIGIDIKISFDEPNSLRNRYGIKTSEDRKILHIHPESEAYQYCMVGDKIIGDAEVKNDGASIQFFVERHTRKIKIVLLKKEKLYFPSYNCELSNENPYTSIWME